MDDFVDNSGSESSVKQTCVSHWIWVFLPKPCPREERSAILVKPWYKHAILLIHS